MAGCSSFKLTVTKLVVFSLFVFLTVVLHVTSNHLFDVYAVFNKFSSSYSAETNNTHGKTFNYRFYNETLNAIQFAPKPVSEHPFRMEEIINPHNFEFVIRPNVTCSGREVELAICVVVKGDNHAGRSVIRRTWGSYAKDPNNKAVLLFFIGSDKTETDKLSARQSRLQKEALSFGDIVQENYIDSYRNLSLKTVSVLRWVNLFCPNAKYILKVDDDVYVNIPLLIKSLHDFAAQLSPPGPFIFGYLIADNGPHRDPTSKWHTPYTVYREEKYPNFVSGTAYVMTGEAAVLSYEASLRIPLFWLEDVYITGLCARKAKVRVYGSNLVYNGKLTASGCTFRTMASGHGYTLEEIVKIHSELSDPNLKC
ncbi:unnamed protein product [Candidula unifasciata]|uniref:Hexosyltransferase n=1 Tax=Candidula unifasciata TaxID=100452 RepID=A0A8S3YJN4_9EUPU|nr:unnamed protein product [Candidula unifasciata]